MFIIFLKLSWYIVIRFFRHGRSQRTFDLYYLSIINPTNLNMSCCMSGAFDCWWSYIHKSEGQFANELLHERRLLTKLYPPIKRCLGKCNERWADFGMIMNKLFSIYLFIIHLEKIVYRIKFQLNLLFFFSYFSTCKII